MAIGPMTVAHLKGPRIDPGLLGMSDEGLLTRFIDRGDEAAFEAIVVRHASRVLGVCRQVLRRPHDVEDAFQATFRLLALNAARIKKRASLGFWLHGVAHRLSVRLKVKAARSASIEGERRGVAMTSERPEDDVDRRELKRIVHEEIDTLPETLRRPILLCYLEGLTNEEAARHLGCPTSTLKRRLGRAREILHGRLARRGLALSAALLVLILPETASASDVPRRLIESTVLAAMAALGRRGAPAAVAGPDPGAGSDPAAGRPGPASRLPLAAVAAAAAGAIATVALYLSSPDRGGFLAWMLGAIRRACH